MDNFSIHLASLPRLFPSRFPLHTLGHLPHKSNCVNTVFPTFNYSFILRGEGEYKLNGKSWPVKAPCVITQWPNVFMEYGPKKEWEELYLIYSPEVLSAFVENKMADMSKPVWYIRDSRFIRRKLSELRELISEPEARGRADEIDRVCESMIISSFIGERGSPLDEKERAILLIRDWITEHFLEDMDFDDLALEHGFSPSGFRRYWQQHMELPPAKYVAELRIAHACRLLVETNMKMSDIAEAAGFDDPLYFSRRFRKITGETASRYRQLHQSELSLRENKPLERKLKKPESQFIHPTTPDGCPNL